MKGRSIGEIDPVGFGVAKVYRDGGTEPESRNGIWKRPILRYQVRRACQATDPRPLSTMTPSQVTSGAARVRGSLQP